MSEVRGTLGPPVAAPIPVLELPAALAHALGRGHPWVYKDHVPRGFEAPKGAFVRVRAGSFSAVALWDPGSQLALRVFSAGAVPDAGWVEARVRAALALREDTSVTRVASAYRWIAGEGDGLPGVTVDRYGAFAVVSLDSDALDGVLPWVVAGLERAARLQGIVRKKRAGRGPSPGPLPVGSLEVLAGRLPPRDLVVEEHGLRFRANLFVGQKTGLFLDQRENRRFVEGLSSGRRVVNLFGYTGGFSLYAVRGGATHVTTVDIAEAAMEDARENFRLNGFDAEAHDFVAADVFDWLASAAERGEAYDLVVCDPPSFARSRAHRDKAIQAYARLHAAGLAVTAPNGFYAASSCTTQVGPDAFREALALAAQRARVRFQVVHDAAHAPDHPILAGHPEGRYLKFVVGRVTKEA